MAGSACSSRHRVSRHALRRHPSPNSGHHMCLNRPATYTVGGDLRRCTGLSAGRVSGDQHGPQRIWQVVVYRLVYCPPERWVEKRVSKVVIGSRQGVKRLRSWRVGLSAPRWREWARGGQAGHAAIAAALRRCVRAAERARLDEERRARSRASAARWSTASPRASPIAIALAVAGIVLLPCAGSCGHRGSVRRCRDNRIRLRRVPARAGGGDRTARG